ncbi:hypothetical protein, partial [Ideonella dechloratans]
LTGPLPPLAALRSAEEAPTGWLALLGQVADGAPDPGLWTLAQALSGRPALDAAEVLRSDVLTGAWLCSLGAGAGEPVRLALPRPEPLQDPAAAVPWMPLIQRLVLLRLAGAGRFRYSLKLRLSARDWQALRRAPLPVWQRCVLAWFHLLHEGRWPAGSPEGWAQALRTLVDPTATPPATPSEDPLVQLQHRLAAWVQSDRPEAEERLGRWLARRAHPAASSFSGGGAGQGSPASASGTG